MSYAAGYEPLSAGDDPGLRDEAVAVAREAASVVRTLALTLTPTLTLALSLTLAQSLALTLTLPLTLTTVDAPLSHAARVPRGRRDGAHDL